MEAGLDPLIHSQITGIQSALEVWMDLSRSKKKSPRTPIALSVLTAFLLALVVPIAIYQNLQMKNIEGGS